MSVYKIIGTTMKERAILEYYGISYTCIKAPGMSSHFPIKDIEVTTELSKQELTYILNSKKGFRNPNFAVEEIIHELVKE